MTIDGWRLLRYCLCQSASYRTISVAAAEITLSAAPSRGIDVQPRRCYNENTISDTGHHADADGLKGLTGGCVFIFRQERKDAKGRRADDKRRSRRHSSAAREKAAAKYFFGGAT